MDARGGERVFVAAHFNHLNGRSGGAVLPMGRCKSTPNDQKYARKERESAGGAHAFLRRESDGIKTKTEMESMGGNVVGPAKMIEGWIRLVKFAAWGGLLRADAARGNLSLEIVFTFDGASGKTAEHGDLANVS